MHDLSQRFKEIRNTLISGYQVEGVLSKISSIIDDCQGYVEGLAEREAKLNRDKLIETLKAAPISLSQTHRAGSNGLRNADEVADYIIAKMQENKGE